MELLDDGVMITDPDRIIVWVNPSFTKITGYALSEVQGHKPNILSSRKHGADFYSDLQNKLDFEENWQGEIWNRKKDGAIYPEWLSIKVIKDSFGRVLNYVGIFSDITKQKAKEEHSHYLSNHDPLTGLANRYLLQETLASSILDAKRSKLGIGVLFIDIDGFKRINDTFGHAMGDMLLKDAANALVTSIRESDLAARQGGDEFIVILERLSSINDALNIAKKISRPIYLKNSQSEFVTLSIGISYYDGTADTTAKALIERADMAMYEAKRSGKSEIRLAGKM